MHTTTLNIREATPSVIGRCERCIFLKECDGIPAFSQLWNCFDQYPYQQFSDDVCPDNPQFAERIAEIRGLRFDNIDPIIQSPTPLPLYIPHLNHRYSRAFPLDWPIVAITTYELFRIVQFEYKPVVSDASSLRNYFHLSPQTRIILRGTDNDPPLEKFWTHRRRDRAAERLSQLGIDLIIGPNFSHFNDVPRTDNLFNRKRQLICLEEMVRAGLNVVPHLNETVDADWRFWRDFLRNNPTIKIVAKEFQTGNKKKSCGIDCIQRIDQIQQFLGRPLHPILIGGAQFLEEAAMRFENFTILDSRPFMNAVNRRYFRSHGRRPTWVHKSLLPKIGVDDYVHENFERYSLWLALRAKSNAGLQYLRHRKAG
jgi:hypothetical protein